MEELNRHRAIVDPEIHEAKGFFVADRNTFLLKNEQGKSAWDKLSVFPSFIGVVSPLSAPPSTVNKDVYILNNTGGGLDVNNINWQSATTVRYSFSGSPDLSIYSVGWNIIIKGEPVSSHNGTFLITAINNTTKYVELVNPVVINNALDVAASIATANITHVGWTGCEQNDWVRYDSISLKWFGAAPVKGTLSYNKTTDIYWSFNGTTWIVFAGGGGSSVVTQLKYIIGTSGQSGCDYTFTSVANNTEQNILLGAGAILPADCPVISMTIKAITGTGSSSVVNVGKSNSTDEYVSDVDFQTTNFIKSFSSIIDPSTGASSFYFRLKPVNNWSTLTGKWKIWINFITNL